MPNKLVIVFNWAVLRFASISPIPRRYAHGEKTAVDAFFAPVAFRIRSYKLKLSAKAWEYCERLLSLESIKAWGKSALQEPDHEKETEKYGTIIKDHRSA